MEEKRWQMKEEGRKGRGIGEREGEEREEGRRGEGSGGREERGRQREKEKGNKRRGGEGGICSL